MKPCAKVLLVTAHLLEQGPNCIHIHSRDDKSHNKCFPPTNITFAQRDKNGVITLFKGIGHYIVMERQASGGLVMLFMEFKRAKTMVQVFFRIAEYCATQVDNRNDDQQQNAKGGIRCEFK